MVQKRDLYKAECAKYRARVNAEGSELDEDSLIDLISAGHNSESMSIVDDVESPPLGQDLPRSCSGPRGGVAHHPLQSGGRRGREAQS
eukprot:14078190-Alexandrium_andersonii.AAC.1